MTLDEKTVSKLEHELEKAIAQVILKMGLKKLPLLPTSQTMQLMAKAASAVYESAVESQQRKG